MNKCCNRDNRGTSFCNNGFIILVLFILLAIIASAMFTY